MFGAMLLPATTVDLKHRTRLPVENRLNCSNYHFLRVRYGPDVGCGGDRRQDRSTLRWHRWASVR